MSPQNLQTRTKSDTVTDQQAENDDTGLATLVHGRNTKFNIIQTTVDLDLNCKQLKFNWHNWPLYKISFMVQSYTSFHISKHFSVFHLMVTTAHQICRHTPVLKLGDPGSKKLWDLSRGEMLEWLHGVTPSVSCIVLQGPLPCAILLPCGKPPRAPHRASPQASHTKTQYTHFGGHLCFGRKYS